MNVNIGHEAGMVLLMIATVHEAGKETSLLKPPSVFCIISILAFIIDYSFSIHSKSAKYL